MTKLFRPRKRTVLFACLMTAVGWIAWTEVSAQPANSEGSITIDTDELRSELNNEQKRHSAALATLQKARTALESAKADTAAIDGLIAAENADHSRRERKLKAWLDSASAQNDDDASRTRSIINRELRDIGKAIGSLNQSVRITPISSPSAQTGGTRFVDYTDAPDHQKQNAEESDQEPTKPAGTQQPGPQAGAEKPLGEALFREVPRGDQSEPVENPSGIDQVQERIEALSRQLAALQRQLAELKSAQSKQ